LANIPPIQLKRSHTAGAQPTPDQLAVGEFAINMPDATVWTKDSDGNVISVGGGASPVVQDSDAMIFLDSDGNVTATVVGDYDINIITADRDGTSWQNNTVVQNAPEGARINVMRRVESGERWTMERTVGTDTGWDTLRNNEGVAVLDYAGTASYALCPTRYDGNFKVHEAFTSDQDHASFNRLNDYWIWQFFPTPVTIGDGTDLGSFSNGRPAWPNTDYFREFSVDFYDADNNVIASQRWSGGTNVSTYTINTTGTINGVRSIMWKGHNGNSGHPGFNRINLKVNGSTAYPTANGAGWEWGGAYRNITGGTNISDSDEAIALLHVSGLTTGLLVNGAQDAFGSGDWCPNGNVDTNNQVYNFYFNRPWDIGGGTFTNGRTNYSGQFWREFDVEYYDADDNLVFDTNISTPVYSTTNQLFAQRNIWKIIMRPGTRSANHPVIQNWFPNLGWSSAATYPNSNTIDQPEIWVKNSIETTTPAGTYYSDGAVDPEAFSSFTKLSN